MMTIKTVFAVPEFQRSVDTALFVLRFVAGIAFMYHGWGKIQDPFGWMGPDSFAPGIFQALAALSEFGGGLAWLLGLFTPLASLGIGATMLVGAWMHAVMRGDPFVAAGGGASYELAMIYFCIALLFLAAGPGRMSVDRAIFGVRPS